MKNEIWKSVVGYENLYEVSNFGNVRSVERYVKYTKWKKENQFQLRKQKLLKQVKMRNGYMRVEMSDNGKHKLNLVHRLVAQAFIPNPNNCSQINHKDGNKENNFVDNLEWCSCKENMKHAWRNGLYSGKRIAQYKNNELIAIYDNVVSAVRTLGYNNSGQNIGKVALGKRKSAYGYQWKYI